MSIVLACLGGSAGRNPPTASRLPPTASRRPPPAGRLPLVYCLNITGVLTATFKRQALSWSKVRTFAVAWFRSHRVDRRIIASPSPVGRSTRVVPFKKCTTRIVLAKSIIVSPVLAWFVTSSQDNRSYPTRRTDPHNPTWHPQALDRPNRANR